MVSFNLNDPQQYFENGITSEYLLWARCALRSSALDIEVLHTIERQTDASSGEVKFVTVDRK